jgi:hypothetical protein
MARKSSPSEKRLSPKKTKNKEQEPPTQASAPDPIPPASAQDPTPQAPPPAPTPQRSVEHKMKPSVILIGADKGGVGKTTIARAVLDYLLTNNVLARAFDTECPRGTLHRFHPNESVVVDLTSAADQMKIIDTLETSEVKVSIIDVRAGGFSTALQALEDMGFLDAVAQGEFNFLIFHVLGSSIASLDEIDEIAHFVKHAQYFLVKNHVNDTTFFEWDPQVHRKYFEKVNTSGEVVVPKLNELAYEQVEIAGEPFSAFVANLDGRGEPANHSFVLRGYVRTWFNKVAEEFDRSGLLGLVSPRMSRTLKSGRER